MDLVGEVKLRALDHSSSLIDRLVCLLDPHDLLLLRFTAVRTRVISGAASCNSESTDNSVRSITLTGDAAWAVARISPATAVGMRQSASTSMQGCSSGF
jgi:hypothetical protein